MRADPYGSTTISPPAIVSIARSCSSLTSSLSVCERPSANRTQTYAGWLLEMPCPERGLIPGGTLVEVQVARLHPIDARIGDLDHYQRVGRSVSDLRVSTLRPSRPDRAGADDRHVASVGDRAGFRWAVKRIESGLAQPAVVRAIPRLVTMLLPLVVEHALVHVRQQQDAPANQRFAFRIRDVGGGITPVPIVVTGQCQSNLSQVIRARVPATMVSRLNRRHQQANQDQADDQKDRHDPEIYLRAGLLRQVADSEDAKRHRENAKQEWPAGKQAQYTARIATPNRSARSVNCRITP